MVSDGKYIYGIIEAEPGLEFGRIGLGEQMVTTIGLGGLACVVSDSHLDVYIANAVNLAEHERVLERVMSEYVILPMRFGTVAGSDREITLMVKRHGKLFLRLLKKLAGQVEVELEIRWKDMKSVFDELVEHNSALKKLKADPRAKSMEDTIMAGQMVYKLLQEKKKKESEGFIKTLKTVSEGCVVNKNARDELVMNASFLVAKEKLALFDRALDSLDANTGGRFAIKYIGPLPPYSFVEMRMK